MNYDEWPPALRSALWMLAVVGGVWLLSQLLALIAFFRDIILLFFLAWLLSFALRPVVDRLTDAAVPGFLTRRLQGRGWRSWGERLAALRLSRLAMTALVYLGLLVLVVTTLIFVAPVAVTQLGQLALRLPAYGAQALAFFQRLQIENPVWLERLNAQAAEFGVNLEEAYRSLNIVTSMQAVAGRLAQSTLGIAAGFATLMTDLFLVLILSFYMTLDTPRLSRWFIDMVPGHWQDECQVLFLSVDRTFGGFIRGQLLMAVLSSVGTMIIMQLAGLNFVVVVSLFAGTIMLIPVIGAPIALFLPFLIALFQTGLPTALAVFVTIFALQQLVLHIMMPRIMSQTMGMHPLLVFAALLMGVRVAGFWGALFGIPVIGVLAAMLNYIYQRNVLGITAGEPEASPASDAGVTITTPPLKLKDRQPQ